MFSTWSWDRFLPDELEWNWFRRRWWDVLKMFGNGAAMNTRRRELWALWAAKEQILFQNQSCLEFLFNLFKT